MNPRLILSAVHISQDIEKIKGDFEEQIPGGKGEGKCIDDFDFFALLKGVLVELEHTDDPMLALEITMDHLSESPEYYDYLDDMEEQMISDGAMEEEDEEESEDEEIEKEVEEEDKDDDEDEEEEKKGKGDKEESESLEKDGDMADMEMYDIP